MEQKTNIKSGDFVRLTDPISNGEIVRIESIDEHGFASWLGGSQATDMEQVSIADGASPIGNDIDGYYFDLSEIITEIERRVNAQTWLNLKKPFKVYPESAVEYWKNRAEVDEKEHAYYEKAWNKEHNKLLDAQDYIKKVCKESSVDIQRLDAENKKLKEENAELRLEVQGYIANLNKTAEAASYFIDKYEAAKRQLDESNKQIEIYAKKVRNLEAELEEGGFNDERNFI